MRLLLILQLILHENIIDIYKSDYNWDQLTSILIKHYSDFNSLKYFLTTRLKAEWLLLGNNLIMQKRMKKNNAKTSKIF